jgi:2-amino-4-hydroxy-6-hydroxymethyldihydropteridine diphosphokinase
MKQIITIVNMKENNIVFLSIGSNLGNRSKNITTAIKALKKIGKITAISSIYQTEPVGYKKQKEFLNLALKLETNLLPIELLKKTQQIEQKIGKVKKIKNGPRKIDIDLIFYNNEIIINTNQLILPHPRMHQRKFVLVPLKEIAANQIHPIKNQTISELLISLKDDHYVELVK